MDDASCTETFTKHAVNIYSPSGTTIITDWREATGTRLCIMSILPNPSYMPLLLDDQKTTILQAFSDYYLPSV